MPNTYTHNEILLTKTNNKILSFVTTIGFPLYVESKKQNKQNETENHMYRKQIDS